MKKSFLCVTVLMICLLSCSKKANTDDQERDDFSVFDTTLASAIDTAGLAAVAKAHYDANSYKESVEEYSVLIKLNPATGMFYFRRGYGLLQLNRPVDAIPDYLKSAELNYRKADCYFSIGLCYLMVKDDGPAVKYFNKCLEVDPNYDKAKKYLQAIRESNKDVDL